ncbi:uncharacterized protein TNCV_103391 [Trichonephila clavipes]|nr:uncharacterized protein TNCV_103391 [Trichonephila clavipes]
MTPRLSTLLVSKNTFRDLVFLIKGLCFPNSEKCKIVQWKEVQVNFLTVLVSHPALDRFKLHQPLDSMLFVQNYTGPALVVLRGRSSLVVKESDRDRHVMSSSPVPLKTRRVGERCTLNLSRAQASSRWWDVIVRRGGVRAQVSSSSLDHGSK